MHENERLLLCRFRRCNLAPLLGGQGADLADSKMLVFGKRALVDRVTEEGPLERQFDAPDLVVFWNMHRCCAEIQLRASFSRVAN